MTVFMIMVVRMAVTRMAVMRMIVPGVAAARVVVMVSVVVSMAMVVMTMVRRLSPARFVALIGAAFRLERRLDGDHPRAKRAEQRFDIGIAADAQAARTEFGGDVAIAEMEGKPRKRWQIGGARLDERLGCGDDFHAPAVFQHQAVVGAQPHLWQIDLNGEAVQSGENTARRLPLRAGEKERVDHRTVMRLARPEKTCRAHHDAIPSVWPIVS
jgi:hypothetical protein